MALTVDLETELSAAARRVGSSAIRDLLAVTERPGLISLAGGMPAPDTFPIEAIAAATSAVLGRDGAAAVQYSATEGYRPLREWTAARHGVDVAEVTITAGSQQGLDLVARTLVEPGDVVVTTDPGYVGALQAFRLAGAHLVGIRSDDHGLVVDDLAERLAAGLRPRLAYVVADLANPTGATLTDRRRDRLAALADRYGFWLVEDDPYSALRWAGEAPGPLAGRSDRVVTLGTASKVLCPGLRVGHLLAPPALSAAVVRVKQAADLHTSTLTQRIVHELVTRPGLLDRRLAALPVTYRARAEALTTALRRHLGTAVDFAPPDGGMFVWARLTDPGADSTGLLAHALAADVAFVPGNAFAVTADHAAHLRLSFATPTPAEIDEAVRRLALALDHHRSPGLGGRRPSR
jgi:2-aminoadipate transaminase